VGGGGAKTRDAGEAVLWDERWWEVCGGEVGEDLVVHT